MDTKSIIAKLKTLGLTSSEAQIYLGILELGQTNVSKIAEETRINRRNIYDTLSTLLDKGLIFQIIGEKEGVYAGVDPDKLTELIQSKEIALETILPALESRYQAKKIDSRAIIYKGVDGFKNFLRDILNVGQEVYCLGAKGGWGDKKLGVFAEWFTQERIRRKIKVFNLFDNEMRDAVTKNPGYNRLAEYRFLPKGFSTNSALDIFGDYTVTFTGLYKEYFEDNVTLFVTIDQDLAATWRTWFKFVWDNCSKI